MSTCASADEGCECAECLGTPIRKLEDWRDVNPDGRDYEIHRLGNWYVALEVDDETVADVSGYALRETVNAALAEAKREGAL